MHDLLIPAVLVAVVLLLILGQWLALRRARSIEGVPLPEGLARLCPQAELVFFESVNCRVCHQMHPTLVQIEKSRPISVCRVDILQHPDIAREMRIMGTPTLVLIRDGRVRAVRLGMMSANKLNNLIKRTFE